MAAADPVLIGIDLGTSACKAAAYDHAGRQLALVRQAIPTTFLPEGRVEQSVDDWWQAVVDLLQGLRRQGLLEARRVAVGACGHWPSTALLGPHGEALRPAIIWQDARGQLPAAIPVEWLAQHIGLPREHVVGLPVAKLGWLRQHEAHLFEPGRLRWCLSTKDVITFRLTGRAVTDPVEAWWTGLAGAAGTAWEHALSAAIGYPAECLPEILPMDACAGTITRQAQAATGLPAGTLVATGTGDGYCAAVGAGMAEDAVVIVGSSTIVAAHVPGGTPLPANPSILRFPALRAGHDVWYASLAMGTIEEMVFVATGVQVAPAAREEALGMTLLTEAPLFVPVPGKPVAMALDPSTPAARRDPVQPWSAAELYRAGLQSFGFSIRYRLAAMTGSERRRRAVCLAGGGAAEDRMGQIFADDLDRPVVRRATTELGCLGAAMLATVAAGVSSDLSQAVAAMAPPLAQTFQPRSAVHEWTEVRYQRYTRAIAQHGIRL